MHPPLIFLVFWQIQAALCQRPRIVIDKQSCDEEGDHVYAQVTSRFQNAIAQAKLAHTQLGQLEAHVKDLSQVPNSDRIVEKVRWVRGDDMSKQIKDAAEHYKRISQFELDLSVDPQSKAWTRSRVPEDVEVFCNAKHIRYDEGKGVWVDPLRGERDVKDLRIEYRSGGGSVHAETFPPSARGQAHTIFITPQEIWRQQRAGWPGPSPQTVQRLSQDAQFAGTLADRLKRTEDTAPIDMVGGLGETALHELGHTTVGGEHKDVPDGNAYGWINVLAAHDPRNADGLALLATAIKLIVEENHDVTREGTIVPIKGRRRRRGGSRKERKSRKTKSSAPEERGPEKCCVQ